MPTIPDRLRHDPDWAPVAIVLDAFAPDDDRVWKHVHFATQSDPMPRDDIDFDAMLVQEAFSQTEALLLLTAASLWGEGRFGRTLEDEAAFVSDEPLRTVLRAVGASAAWAHNQPDRPWTLRLSPHTPEALSVQDA